MLNDFMPDGIRGNNKEGGKIIRFGSAKPPEQRKVVGGFEPLPKREPVGEPPKNPKERAKEKWGHEPEVTRTPDKVVKKSPGVLKKAAATVGVLGTLAAGAFAADRAGVTPAKVAEFVRGQGNNAPTAQATEAPVVVAPTATEKLPTIAPSPTEAPATATAKPTEKPPTVTVEAGPTRAQIAADVGVENLSERSLIYEDENGVIVGGFILDKMTGQPITERPDVGGPGGAPGAFEYLREKIFEVLPVDWDKGGKNPLVTVNPDGTISMKMFDFETGALMEKTIDPKKPIFIVPVDSYEELGQGAYNNVFDMSCSFDSKESGFYIYTYNGGNLLNDPNKDYSTVIEGCTYILMSPSLLQNPDLKPNDVVVSRDNTQQGIVATNASKNQIGVRMKQSFSFVD